MLDRGGFAKDRNHVYQLDRISDDPAHFELLDGGLSKNSTAVYWTDGGVLSDDPAHFAIVVANNDHYLFTKDSRTVHVNGKPIADADPATFRVLNAAFECSADVAARVLSANPSSPARIRGLSTPGPRCHDVDDTSSPCADPRTFPPAVRHELHRRRFFTISIAFVTK